VDHGWCADPDDARLRAALDARELHYLLRLTRAADAMPPRCCTTRLGAAVRGVRAADGRAGHREADRASCWPSWPADVRFMFGDVAQGLIVAAAGFLLRRRLPALRLLVPVAWWGRLRLRVRSVFAREDVIAPLWLHPSRAAHRARHGARLRVLLIVVGLLLNALQFHWRGELRHWFAADAGLLVAYLACRHRARRALLWALPSASRVAGRQRPAGAGRPAEGTRAGRRRVPRAHAAARRQHGVVRARRRLRARARRLSTAVVGIAEASEPPTGRCW